MREEDAAKLSAEEFWEFHKSQKYSTSNSISKRLVNGFFKSIYELTEQTLSSCDTYLEVGCGPGESSLKLNDILIDKHFEVSDFDPRFIEMFERVRFPIKYSNESVYDLKREDNSFDCIFLLEVLEHLDNYERALSELSRVSKNYLIISVPHEPIWRILNMARMKYLNSFGNTPGHVNNWSNTGFKKLISKYGKIVDMRTPLPWQMVLVDVS
jgi:ubiquinone/menaquinone biosynthesis C-methylase UbiE